MIAWGRKLPDLSPWQAFAWGRGRNGTSATGEMRASFDVQPVLGSAADVQAALAASADSQKILSATFDADTL